MPDPDVEMVRGLVDTLCDAADWPGAAQAGGELPKDWHPCRDTHAEALAALSRITSRLEELQLHDEAATHSARILREEYDGVVARLRAIEEAARAVFDQYTGFGTQQDALDNLRTVLEGSE